MRVLTSAIDLFGDGVEGKPPIAFRIWAAGEHQTDKGNWIFSPASAAAIMATQAERGNLFSIDVDHMSLNQSSPIDARKAVGWHRLELRGPDDAPELWACDVQWTDEVSAGLVKHPPEWRYFSPAYDVDQETREVTRYINTALTNNPATHNVTALAASAAANNGDRVMAKVDIDATLAALRAAADGDDEKMAKRCRAALATFHAAEEAHDEKQEASEASDDDKKDEKQEASVAASVDVIKSLHATTTKLAALEAKIERDKLFDARPDVSATIKATMANLPIATVKALLDELPRGSTSHVQAARAALGAEATKSESEPGSNGTRADRLPEPEAKSLSLRMGLADNTPRGVIYDGVFQRLPVMTPQQARAALSAKAKQAQVSK